MDDFEPFEVHAPDIDVAGEAAPVITEDEKPPRIAYPDWIERAQKLGWTWAVKAWRRSAAYPGAWFDAKKAQGVVDLWPSLMRLTDDRFAGHAFHLVFWEECIVRLLIGWKVPTPVQISENEPPRIVQVRLYREMRLWVPRKAGKTEFISALGLIIAYVDRTIGGQGFVFAKDIEQGSIPFNKMARMLQLAPPSIADNAQVMKKAFVLKQLNTIFRLLPGVPDGKHGKSPTVIVGDEMHEWKTIDLMTTLRQGTGTRLQPMSLYASTAGLKTNPVGWMLYRESLDILDGVIASPRTLVVIFAADAEADIYDVKTWRSANPTLGMTPTMDFMEDEAARARGNPRAEAHFKAYHLGIWVDAEVRWLPLRKWDACTSDREAWRTRLQALKGRKVIGGFDVSSTQDITALIWWAEPVEPDGKIEIACRFFIPEDTLKKRAEADKRAPWLKWVEIGAIETTPGDAVEQYRVAQAIQEGCKLYEVQRVGYDPWNSTGVIEPLQREGMDVEKLVIVRPTLMNLTGASKQFERLVFGGKFDHGGHPVLRWMAGHCVVRMGDNDNFMPSKKRSFEKIDGIMASVTACALTLKPADPGTGCSFDELYGTAA